MITLKTFMYLIIMKSGFCIEEVMLTSTMPPPNFRKQMEELNVKNPILTKTKDANHNLVSFLVQNVREIFGESEVPTVLFESDSDTDEITLSLRRTVRTLTTTIKEEENIDTIRDEKERNTIAAEPTELLNINIKNDTTLTPKSIRDITEHTELLNLSKDLVIIQKAEQAERENQASKSIEKDIISTKRSCISCNNVAVMECSDPKNKLIPSSVCGNEENLCYSQHTPFGIVDRGCLNVNHNFTTYVCSCNLCNFISISEMPYIFSSKKDWIENVVELSRTKRLRKSIFKDMSCLRCEVDVSTKTGDMLDNANCLEGNVGTLPIQECAENEICGVKAIRSKGYIWRGCITKPLYNYWWTLCDSDLCNYDSLVSIYDQL